MCVCVHGLRVAASRAISRESHDRVRGSETGVDRWDGQTVQRVWGRVGDTPVLVHLNPSPPRGQGGCLES